MFAQNPLNSCNKVACRLTDSNEPLLAIRMNYIMNRGRDYRFTTSQIFWSLGRADKARRLVAREWQESNIPTSQVGGEITVGLTAKVMNVIPLREHLWVDLGHRTNEHQMPIWLRIGNGLEQVKIHALVNDAIESKAWMWNAGLVSGIVYCLPGLSEVLSINTAWEGRDVGMLVAFGYVETVPSREHQVSNAQ